MSGPRFHLVALGCPKARVEAEATLAALLARGGRPVDDPARADVIVVHTCAFVRDARRESLDVLLEMAAARRQGRRPRLVAVGCLPQRWGTALLDRIPEIDALVGCNDLSRVADVAFGTERLLLSSRPDCRDLRPQASVASQFRHTRYLKIAEGCSRRCAFCAIPAIRGPSRSRPVATLIEEARRRVEDGAVELVLVAQDVCRYGADRPGDRVGPPLLRLLERLSRLEGLRWIRLLYLYPDELNLDLLRGLRDLPLVLPYFDIPLQHVTDRMLRRMRRGTRRRSIDALVDRIRTLFSEPTLRTSLIVGHPGETEADFLEMRRFVREAGFDRIGLFRYSDEEGTAAFDDPDKVAPRVAYRRFRLLRAEAREAMRQRQARLRGRVVQVLVDGPASESPLLRVGRTAAQAPEIDGLTYLVGGQPPAGRFVAARITRTSDSDLVADLRLEPIPRALVGVGVGEEGAGAIADLSSGHQPLVAARREGRRTFRTTWGQSGHDEVGSRIRSRVVTAAPDAVDFPTAFTVRRTPPSSSGPMGSAGRGNSRHQPRSQGDP